jgi:hypothetical protein
MGRRGVSEQPDRQARIAAGFDIARALGTTEGRNLVEQSGFRDGDSIAVDSELGRRLAAMWRAAGA